MATHSPGPFLLLAVLAVGACTDTEPYNRPAMWAPAGANARNIAAMAAQPRDLVRGHGDGGGANGRTSADAVARLRDGFPRPLASVSAQSAPGADVAPGAAPAPPPPAGGAN